MNTIRVADYSRNPGPRYRIEGPHSGEEFRETLLIPAFECAVGQGERLLVLLDGVEFGYPTSFLEEAFGGLVRHVNDVEAVASRLEFVSADEPLLVDEVRGYIRDALLPRRNA